MLNEQEQRMQLPRLWKTLNFYSLNLAYVFGVVFVPLQFGVVKNIFIKAFTEANYDAFNGWILIGLLVTSGGSGILGYVRMKNVKGVLESWENKDKP